MSKLREEIKSCMSKLIAVDKEKASADFCFPENFIGFKGHFPGSPVLPGACQIQAAIILFEAHKKKSAELKEIKLAKFFVPVTHSQSVSFFLDEKAEGSSASLVKVTLSSGKEKVSELHLKLAF